VQANRAGDFKEEETDKHERQEEHAILEGPLDRAISGDGFNEVYAESRGLDRGRRRRVGGGWRPLLRKIAAVIAHLLLGAATLRADFTLQRKERTEKPREGPGRRESHGGWPSDRNESDSPPLPMSVSCNEKSTGPVAAGSGTDACRTQKPTFRPNRSPSQVPSIIRTRRARPLNPSPTNPVSKQPAQAKVWLPASFCSVETQNTSRGSSFLSARSLAN